MPIWNKVKFSDCLSNVVDNRGRTCPTAKVGFPLIATNCIKNDSLYPVFENIRYINQETYDNWFRAHPKPGDMIFVCKGSPGRICWTPNPINFCIAQDMLAIRANEEVVYPKYLFALLRSNEVQQAIGNLHVGSLIPHFKKGDFDKLILSIPDDMNFQKKVGDVYFDFCNKIELNRQMNHTLELMAQALFKKYFVDDIDKDNLPVGWRMGKLGEIINNFDSKRVPLSSMQRASRKGIYPYYGAASLMDHVDDYLFDGLFILLGEDGTVITDDGFPVLQYTWGKFWVNNHAHVLQGKDYFSTNFIYLFLKQTSVAHLVTGAVQPKINQGNLNSIDVLIPDKETILKFDSVVDSLYDKFRSNIDEIGILTKLRDTLLPKLMNGEVSVEQTAAIA